MEHKLYIVTVSSKFDNTVLYIQAISSVQLIYLGCQTG